MHNKYHPPVIILGMHRSGTSMITKMLSQLGLFIGHDLEDNSESMFFHNLNDWLLHQSGAAWDNPEPIQWFFQNDKLVRLAEEYIQDRIRGFPIVKYTGWRRFIMNQSPLSGMDQPWGWKDPRTTFTLPFWLNLFPDSRVVYIYRNGISVAASLRARERKLLEMAEAEHANRKALGLYNIVRKKGGFVWSNRCLSLEGGFSLWEEYISIAMKMIDEVAPYSMSLKYENILEHPAKNLFELANFCGLSPSEGEARKVASVVKPKRANAFVYDEELKAFYLNVKSRPLMEKLGYA